MPAKPIVVGLGELLWDCFADHRRPGGAPANVAFHAQQLGDQGVVCTRIGEDPLGDELLSYLADNSLSTDYIQSDALHPTGWVTVHAQRADAPAYTIHEEVAWDYLQPDPALLGLMRQSAAVCFGTLAQRNSVARKTIYSALAATGEECLRVYDVNLRQQWYTERWVHDSLARSTICKLNLDEVSIVGDLLRLNTHDPRRFAEEIFRRYPVQLVCVTRAEGGCLLIDRTESADLPAPSVEVVDAVGAGDSTTAAIIHAQLRGWPLDITCQLANAIGALVVQHQGAMPPLATEYAELLKQFRPQR